MPVTVRDEDGRAGGLRARHAGGVLPVVTGFREGLPVGEEVLTPF